MAWEIDQIVVLALLGAVLIAFLRERLSPDVVAMSAVAVLLVTGILTAGEVLEVFSNSAPITVGCMFVLSAALERTGIIDLMGQAVSRSAGRHSPTRAVIALMASVMVVSAFINNTPVVVILTPVVIALAKTLKSAPSQLLMPLSFAGIFGGICTLIGTSTNILVDGVARKQGLDPFGMFEITAPGAILGLVGTSYMLLIGHRLLPKRETLSSILSDKSKRQFLAEVLVPQDSPVVGKTLAQAHLTQQPNAQVIDVIRHDISMRRILDRLTLEAGDRLVLKTSAGEVMGLRETENLVVGHPGALEPIATRKTAVMEGIVGPRSHFIGRRLADLNLRRLYGVYILAVHRQNENLRSNFDQVRLAVGDTLLMEGPPEGLKRLFNRRVLVNLTKPEERPLHREKAPIAILAIVLLMGLAAFNIMPIVALALIAATAVIALGCLRADEAYEAIEWRILMLIFGMLALGSAMEKTGAALLIVEEIIYLAAGLGPITILSIIYLLTSITTELVSNNAAAILFTPIAVGIAQQLGLDPRPFAVAVMFAASATFSTPIGYQTNTFVYNAGGYKFTDFVKVGIPLNLLMWATATLVIPWFWPLAGK